MTLTRLTFLFLLFSLEIFPARGQSVTQPIEWFGTTSNLKIGPKSGFMIEGLYRFAHAFQPMQFQFRFGLDFYLTNKFSIMPLAYAYTWNPIYGDQPAAYMNNEHRIFQQFLFRHKLGRINLRQRIRTEERFLQKHTTLSNGEVVDEGYTNRQFRLRYRFFFTIPIGRKKIEPKSWYVQIYDEVFIGFGSTVSPQQPEQNRVFAGLGYQFTSSLSIQAGPVYQIIIKPNGSQRENNTGPQITLVYNYDLTKSVTD